MPTERNAANALLLPSTGIGDVSAHLGTCRLWDIPKKGKANARHSSCSRRCSRASVAIVPHRGRRLANSFFKNDFNRNLHVWSQGPGALLCCRPAEAYLPFVRALIRLSSW